MTVQALLPWILGANSLISIATLLYAWLSSSGAAALKRVEAVEDEVKGVDAAVATAAAALKRVETVESDLKTVSMATGSRFSMLEQNVAVLQSTVDHLPSSAITHRLELAIARVEGRIETLTERLQPVAAVATRLQEHAMEEARR